MAAPTFVTSSAGASWDTTTSPKTSGGLTTQSGDLVVSVLGDENDDGNENYTWTSSVTETWTEHTESTGATNGAGFLQSARATCSSAWSAGTVTATRTTGTANRYNHVATVWRGHDGVGNIGNSAELSGTAPSYSFTTSTADSALLVIAVDWNARAAGSRTYTQINGQNAVELAYFNNTVAYTVYVFYFADVGAAGAKTIQINNISASADLIYHAVEIKGATGGTTTVGASRATTWHVKASVTPTRATTWNVRATVASSRATTWRALATTAASRATTWHIRATTLASRATTWRILAAAVSSRATTWNVRAVAAAQRATTWRVLTTTAATRATTWRVLQRITEARATTWNVLSSLVTVGASRATSWRVLAPVTSTRATTWNVRAIVSATRSTLWDVLTTATASRATTWRVLAPATSARATTWRVLQRVTALRTTLWNVLGLETGFQGRILTVRLEAENNATARLDTERHATARLSIPEATGVLS
jgi:hypothetical protein